MVNKNNGSLTRTKHQEPANSDPEPDEYVPRTPLGRDLMEIRKRILDSGEPLLETWDDLEREVAERRGGHYDGTR
jgi:hypothetical protein